MNYITKDGRHFRRVEHEFYGNQHVSLSRKKRIQARKKNQVVSAFKALAVLTIMTGVLGWKLTMTVEAWMTPTIISPIPHPLIDSASLAKARHDIDTKTVVLAKEGTDVPLPTKTPVLRHSTPVTTQHTAPAEDMRITKLHTFLENKNSPLQYYAKEIVDLADYYAIDYTLVPSIAGKESTFGKNIKTGSFNAWGVMDWDSKGHRFIRMFASWDEGIKFETQLLAKHYKLNANEAIAAKYCPKVECSNTWAQDVTEFSEAINQN